MLCATVHQAAFSLLLNSAFQWTSLGFYNNVLIGEHTWWYEEYKGKLSCVPTKKTPCTIFSTVAWYILNNSFQNCDLVTDSGVRYWTGRKQGQHIPPSERRKMVEQLAYIQIAEGEFLRPKCPNKKTFASILYEFLLEMLCATVHKAAVSLTVNSALQ